MRDKLGRFVKGSKLGFQKGHPQSNTGRTHLKKGLTPWNKGKHPEYVQGENNPNWKGGIIEIKGYISIKKRNHPFCNSQGYIFEHRLVMEKMLGRYLLPRERVHHKGTKYPMGSYKDKGDNRPENLKYFPNESTHQKYHHSLNQS